LKDEWRKVLSRRQEDVVALLWQAHQQDPSAFITGTQISLTLNIKDARRHVAPARIKLRRLGWEIESGRKGFRLVEWKGDKP